MALRETDILTGLYTPRFLVAFGARELSFAREGGYPVSLITISVDFLNRASGSLSPDQVRQLGDRIRLEAGEGSLVAHMGDRDMAVLLPGIGQARAEQIAGKIKKTLAKRDLNMTGPIIGKVIVGAASTSGETENFSDLLRSARTALEAARNGGPAMAHPQYV